MIGDKIKSLRKEKGLTQQQLADKLNISRNSLINYENNRRTPSIRKIKKIAEVLGVSYSEIIFDNEKITLSEIVKFDDIENTNVYISLIETELINTENRLTEYGYSEKIEYNKGFYDGLALALEIIKS